MYAKMDTKGINTFSQKVFYAMRRRESMKFYLRILLLLLAAILAMSVFVGCEEEVKGNTGDEDDTDEEAVGFFPDIERKDYGEDFNFYVEGSNGSDMYYMDEDDNDGSPMDEAVYRRQDRVEKFLGVDIVGVKYPDATFNSYNRYIQTAVQNMDGTLDVLITHVHGAVSNLVSDNLLLDLSEFEGIDLDAEYWNIEFMNALELNGSYFLGLSDMNIINTYVIAFNKEMLAQYESSMDKSLYDIVKDREWTLDEMIDLSSLVYADATGDGKTTDDTYGITGTCWVGFCGFLTSSNIPMLEQDQSGNYKVAINQSKYFERADGLINKLRALATSNYAYFDYPPDFHKRSVPISTGRALMETVSTGTLSALLDYDLDFGVLPYPMYDLDQATVGYKSLQWGGYIGVLSYLKNPIMVAETLEMLSFYSENVKVTYYEKLLGKQVADMPDDVAMFDIVWDSLTTDVGQTFINATSGTGDTGICYTVPELVNPNATKNLASYINGKETSVNEGFKKFLNGIG